MNNELYNNFKKSLEQKYNAVCFDIDGTLTVKDTNTVDKKAVLMIVDLLKKKIPVVFITGRGETGLNKLKKEIYDDIINADNITENDVKRIYVLTNDGARLFFSKGITYDDFLSQNYYITTKEELKDLELFNNIIKLHNNSFFNKSYSYDCQTNTIINIRFVFNTNDEDYIEKYYNKIVNIINTNKLLNIKITRGFFEGKSVIQIGTTTKNMAIERTELMIGVPRDSMIRIGDCGDIYGNDYSMLNCKQGYSVDKISGEIDKCFPIFDEAGNILKGVDATIELIKKAKILPTVCLEKTNKLNYKGNFALAEKNIVIGRKKMLNKYNELINFNFCEYNGIDSLFDRESGSIIIPMYEWELIDSNPLKEFWNTKNNENFKYLLRDENNYLLRGSSTYYYFISNRISKNGKDITSKRDVLSWYENYLIFFTDAYNAILKTNNINSVVNRKFFLGILDNFRNVLLILLNHKLVLDYKDKSVLLNISSKNNIVFNNIYNELFNIDEIMKNLCFNNNYVIDKDYACELIHKLQIILANEFSNEKRISDKGDYSKEYRAYREIDNFAENYIAASLYNEKCNNKKYVSACGLSYGGIELPIIAKIIAKDRLKIHCF